MSRSTTACSSLSSYSSPVAMHNSMSPLVVHDMRTKIKVQATTSPNLLISNCTSDLKRNFYTKDKQSSMESIDTTLWNQRSPHMQYIPHEYSSTSGISETSYGSPNPYYSIKRGFSKPGPFVSKVQVHFQSPNCDKENQCRSV